MSDSDEPDFMDDSFVLQAEKAAKPRGDRSYRDIRRLAEAKSHARGTVHSRKQAEAEAREEGLRQNLITEARLDTESRPNKALGMMLKMGFKPGHGLGQSTADEVPDEPAKKKPRITPIDIDVRSGRTGVGIETDQQVRRRKAAAMAASAGASPAQLIDAADFRQRARDTFDERRAQGILRGATRTCEELDRRTGTEASYMWLDPEDVERDRWKKRQARRMGEAVSDDSDVEPDTLDNLSRTVVEDGADATSRQRILEKEAWLRLDARTRLACTLDHLRDVHAYCLWCGCQYDSQEDMSDNCPGELEADH